MIEVGNEQFLSLNSNQRQLHRIIICIMEVNYIISIQPSIRVWFCILILYLISTLLFYCSSGPTYLLSIPLTIFSRYQPDSFPLWTCNWVNKHTFRNPMSWLRFFNVWGGGEIIQNWFLSHSICDRRNTPFRGLVVVWESLSPSLRSKGVTIALRSILAGLYC